MITRRRVLAGSAALAPVAVLGCSGGSSSPGSGPASPDMETATATTTRTPTATPSPTPTPRTGGVGRLQAPRSLSFDTFDAARSGDLSTLEVLARTHSRLLDYADFGKLTLSGGLAASWEQPDDTTVILRMDPAARWQDAPPLLGRAVTSLDAVASIERRKSLATVGGLPAIQRSHDWLSVESVVAPGESTVEIRLVSPDPFFLNTLAGAFALAQAPEAVEAFEGSWSDLLPAQAAGSGPFIFEGFDAEGLVFSAYRSGHRNPLLDGLRIAAPLDPVAQFRERAVYEATTFDRRDSAALRDDPGSEAVAFTRLAENPVITTMFVAEPPWNDLRLRSALAAALDPRELIDRLVGGAGETSGVVLRVPGAGYGLSEQDLDASLGTLDEARTRAASLWQAAGGPSLGTVSIDVPNVFDPRFSASSVVIDMLSIALGPQFRAAVVPYTTISTKASERGYGAGTPAFWFGWGPPSVDPEASRNLFESYSSRGPNAAATGFASEAVDAALDRLVAAEDAEARDALIEEAVAAIEAEAAGGVISWFSQSLDVFRWPLLDRVTPSAWWDQHLDHVTSVDSSDPKYR